MLEEPCSKWFIYGYIKAELHKTLKDREIVSDHLHHFGIGPTAKIVGNKEVNRVMILAALTILKNKD